MFKQNPKTNQIEWRTHLLKSEPFWKSWFVGLSDLFLKAPVAKMLMLADTDRLDKVICHLFVFFVFFFVVVACFFSFAKMRNVKNTVFTKVNIVMCCNIL